MTIEAMKQALEALNKNVGELRIAGARHILRTAIEAAEKQEPYGYVSIGDLPVFRKETPEIGRWETVYTTPPAAQQQWVALKDDEIAAIFEQHHNQYGECESPNFGYERAIEAKLKEKNT